MGQHTLSHDLSGYPPYHPDQRETVPAGARILITNWDHSATDSLIEWGGHTLLVDKDSLVSFARPI
jgi:hypothetical protein